MTITTERIDPLSRYSDAELFNELYHRNTIAIVQLGVDEVSPTEQMLFMERSDEIQKAMENRCWPLMTAFGFTWA